jgi:hypothetical protein
MRAARNEPHGTVHTQIEEHMRNALLLSLAVSSLAATNALAANVEADLQGGRRWAESKTEGDTAGQQINEVTVAARYKIADLGLSVGPTMTYERFRAADLGEDMTGSNYEFGLEAKYSYPVTELITPYAKARYIAYSRGTMDLDSDDVGKEMKFRTYGAQFAVGAALSVAKNVQLTAEAGYGVQMIRVTGGKVDHIRTEEGGSLTDVDADIEGSRKEDFNSKSLTMGVAVDL